MDKPQKRKSEAEAMARYSSSSELKLRNVTQLQNYLKVRGIVCTGQRKDDLVLLCQRSEELGLEVDPDGLLDCQAAIVREKLRHLDQEFTLPTLLESTYNLSVIPFLSYIDVFMYLGRCQEYTRASLRNYKNLEGYAMFKDGYVLDLKAGTENVDDYTFLCFKVKPRTNTKDPSTGLPFYLGWILFSSKEDEDRILNGFCSCRGG